MKTRIRITNLALGTALVACTFAVALASAASGCRPRYAAGEYDAITCSNGYDDDFDGLADCDDPNCALLCGGGGSDSGIPANCGDGIADDAEDCDGLDLRTESCITLGYTGGTLDCTAFCTFDTSACSGGGGCGDEVCGEGESCSSCPSDCGTCSATCGDFSCDSGETCTNCPSDCGACCGNLVCGTGETCSNCPSDCGSCGPTCGDFVCSAGETCSTCATDCGACCGNGLCGSGENCSNCSFDCGTCPSSSCIYDWDPAALQGWTTSNTCTTVGWRTDSYRSVSASYSLYYGSPTSRTYDCAGTTNSGYAFSPSVTLDASAPSLTFSIYMATEGSSTYDRVQLYIEAPAGTYSIWDSATGLSSPGSSGGVWSTETVSLSAYAGDIVSFYFFFDTVDSAANAYEGVYIDEFSVDGSC